MDPNQTLAQLRAAVAEYYAAEDEPFNDLQEVFDRLQEMIELFDSLDRWATNGGFLPDAWKAN